MPSRRRRLERGRTMTARYFSRLAVALAAVFAIVLTPAFAAAQATIVIINNNAAGVGFNDPTPAAPIGGNPGTTLGEQRLFAFEHAAGIWASALTSTVTITVGASFEPLSCTATSAVLGSAGPTEIWRAPDFPLP